MALVTLLHLEVGIHIIGLLQVNAFPGQIPWAMGLLGLLGCHGGSMAGYLEGNTDPTVTRLVVWDTHGHTGVL